jgi:hypothetical protein
MIRDKSMLRCEDQIIATPIFVPICCRYITQRKIERPHAVRPHVAQRHRLDGRGSRLLCHGRVGAVSPKTQFGVWSHLEAISTRIRAVLNRDGGCQRRIAISSIYLRHRSDGSLWHPCWRCAHLFLITEPRSVPVAYTAAGSAPFKHPRCSTPPVDHLRHGPRGGDGRGRLAHVVGRRFLPAHSSTVSGALCIRT